MTYVNDGMTYVIRAHYIDGAMSPPCHQTSLERAKSHARNLVDLAEVKKVVIYQLKPVATYEAEDRS